MCSARDRPACRPVARGNPMQGTVRVRKSALQAPLLWFPKDGAFGTSVVFAVGVEVAAGAERGCRVHRERQSCLEHSRSGYLPAADDLVNGENPARLGSYRSAHALRVNPALGPDGRRVEVPASSTPPQGRTDGGGSSAHAGSGRAEGGKRSRPSVGRGPASSAVPAFRASPPSTRDQAVRDPSHAQEDASGERPIASRVRS